MPIRMLESTPTFTEINLACNSSVNHPLQRAVHRRTTNLVFVTANDFHKIVSTHVSFSIQKDIYDQIAFARSFTARRAEPLQISGLWFHCVRQKSKAEFIRESYNPRRSVTPKRVFKTKRRCTPNDKPQPQVDLAFGFLIVKPPPVRLSTKSTSAPFR